MQFPHPWKKVPWQSGFLHQEILLAGLQAQLCG